MNTKNIKQNFPIVFTNKQGDNIYNPNFKQHFNNLKPVNYIDLAQKIAKNKPWIFCKTYLEKEKNIFIDILENGALSCASFVSNVLYHFQLINDPSLTVNSTITKIKNNKRREVAFNEKINNIKEIPNWTILIRANQKKDIKNDFFISDLHIGFYLWKNKAISNIIINKEKKTKGIAIHNAIRNVPKLDHYDKIEIIKYFIPPNL